MKARKDFSSLRIAITGSGGQVGRALQEAFAPHELLLMPHRDFDVTDPATARYLVEQKPDVVIHAAAMTAVDRCTEEPDEAFRINEGGTENISQACADADLEMVYISTNEVFDGMSMEALPEDTRPRPINVYGRSKLAGEREAAARVSRLYIVRTSW
ncbi:MAG: sugar nucleotide-binding protein, partial [Verrucomicrobiota bacterium]